MFRGRFPRRASHDRHPRDRMRTDRRWQYALVAVLGGVVLAYSGLGGLGGLWSVGGEWVKHADYSHGFLVVPFAVYLLWRNRAKSPDPVAWPNWAGLPLLLGPLPLYLAEADLNKGKEWVQGACFLVSLCGVLVTFAGPPVSRARTAVDTLAGLLCLAPLAFFAYFLWVKFNAPPGTTPAVSMTAFAAAGGLLAAGALAILIRERAAVRWAVPSVVMLALTLPLPASAEVAVGMKLREGATWAALFVFRLLGLPTDRPSPTVLDVGGVKLEVAAACSGLSMLLTFVALTTAIAFVCPPSRRVTDRWAVVASSVPIAVFCNIIRIVASGLVLVAGWKPAFDFIVHDFAGWLMPIAGLGLVWAEFKLIDWLLVPVERVSREEALKAGMAEARAEIERQQRQRQAWTGADTPPPATPHPAAPFLPLTRSGTAHGATAAGGTLANPPETPPPKAPPEGPV